MTTRRKPGKAGKSSTAPRKATATRARASAPAKRTASQAAAPKSGAAKSGAAKSGAPKSPAAKAAATKGRVAEPAPLATVPADCTIAQSGDLKADLARVLDLPAAVTLDLSAVRRIDTAALQVLVSFIRERRAAGRGVECRGASDAFLATADVLGLRALFSLGLDDRLAAPAMGNA
jgi:ABC-type transporter Mla MlaB component